MITMSNITLKKMGPFILFTMPLCRKGFQRKYIKPQLNGSELYLGQILHVEKQVVHRCESTEEMISNGTTKLAMETFI